MSIHDMQMVMHPDTSTILSRSLSESDLSEICGLGGATGSDPPSPVHMHMAPSDDDDNTGTHFAFFKKRSTHRSFSVRYCICNVFLLGC